jgi:hypothetical protein
VSLLAAKPGLAQISVGGATDRYDGLYGEPIDVSVDDLVQGGERYARRAVRVRGQLATSGTGADRIYSLRGRFGGSVLVLPVHEVAFEFENQAMKWLGSEVEITGNYEPGTSRVPTPGQPSGYVQFWRFFGPEPELEEPPKDTPEVSLEALVTDPDGYDDRIVRVVGQFRGRNLFGDLPRRSGRSRSDWVIKHDLYAIWVVGKKPKGEGFELDIRMRRDTGKWLSVVGRPETVRGVTYLRAVSVSLAEAPAENPTVADQSQPLPPPRQPPAVVFSLPLDGEPVAPDGRFTLQFSNDMETSSFEGRVVFRYVGPAQPGDQSFGGLKLTYDGGRRALTVDPGDRLRPGREVEVLLLPGIADVEGLTLEPRPDARIEVEGAIDALRWYVET